jgi:hypothetical protein
MQRYFSDLKVDVEPHAGLPAPIALPARASPKNTLRIALIGAIGTHKGYQILLRCARDARARKLPLEFVVIGLTENDAPLLATGKVFVTGYYGEAEAPHLLQRERPDIAWLPSVSPETWCYTLDYALAAELPVVAFDVGAIAERLRALSKGDLLPLDLEPSRINDRLIALGNRQGHFTDSKSFMTDSKFLQSQAPIAPDDVTIMPEQADGKRMIKSTTGKPAPDVNDVGLSASVQVLPLPPGLYLFSVKSAGAQPASAAGQLSLPALHVGLGPGVRSDQVEFVAGPSTHGAWLFTPGDLLVTKINGTGATLVMTSVRAPGGEVLSIAVERLGSRGDIAAAMGTAPVKDPAVAAARSPGNGSSKGHTQSVFQSANDHLPLPVQISAHIRTRGDLNFANVPWAGRVAPGLWIEAFSVRPLERFAAADIEYKGLTGSGFETPWLSDNAMCGTKGMATPLVGFAIRLKPSTAAAAYDCEYSGYFQSGTTVGPLKNGAPCRSSVANDSLEGIQLRLVKRAAAHVPEAARQDRAASAVSKPVAGKKSASTAAHAAMRGARASRRPHTRRP